MHGQPKDLIVTTIENRCKRCYLRPPLPCQILVMSTPGEGRELTIVLPEAEKRVMTDLELAGIEKDQE